MSIRRFLAAVCAATLLSCGIRLPAGAQAPASATPAQITTLGNGLRVVVLEDHAAPVVQVAMWYRFGSDFETPGKTGLAHGLEHMMFRGTPSLSSAALDDLGARLGAEFNANTNDEFTHFYFVVPADRADLMIHIEADRMRNLNLSQKDWAIEKQAVLQEWDQDYSNPLAKFAFGIQEKLYPNSPAGKIALGKREDIVRSTAADLKKYYDEYYAPNDATLVVTGDVKAADIFASAKQWFGPIPSRPLPKVTMKPPIAATGASVTQTSEFPFEVLDLAYAMPGDNPQTERALETDELALAALQNERGPFRKALVDSGLTLGYIFAPQTSRRASVAQALFLVAPGHTAQDVRAAFDKTLAETLQSGIDADLIAAAKRSEISNLTYARDSISGLGDGLGSGYVFPGDTDPATFDRVIAGITAEEVNAAAKVLLAKPNVVGDLKPTSTDPSKAKPPGNLSGSVADNFTGRVPNGPIIEAPWVKAAIARPLDLASRVKPVDFTLPNGLHLLVQEVHSNPTVIVDGTIRRSDTFDPAGKEGLEGITSELLGYGSAKYDFAAQHKLGDDTAADISFGASFSAHGFAKDLPAFIGAFADDLEHPLFPEERFTLVRAQNLAAVTRAKLAPSYRSQRAFLEALYPPGDPALREASATSISAITLDDVKAFAQQFYRPDLTTIVVVGDVNAEDVHQTVLKAFGDWTATGTKPDTTLPPIPLPKPVRKYVDSADQRDDAVQLGTVGIARTNPDFYAFNLMNSLLGNGSFDSRLMDEVRQKRGLVYNISSSNNAGRDRGTFEISFRAIPAKVDTALAVVKQQLRRLQTEPVKADDLARQRTKLIAGAVIAEESTFEIAGDVANIAANNLPLEYYTTFAQRYSAITPADVLRVAKQYLHPDNLIEVRTGPQTGSITGK